MSNNEHETGSILHILLRYVILIVSDVLSPNGDQAISNQHADLIVIIVTAQDVCHNTAIKYYV